MRIVGLVMRKLKSTLRTIVLLAWCWLIRSADSFVPTTTRSWQGRNPQKLRRPDERTVPFFFPSPASGKLCASNFLADVASFDQLLPADLVDKLHNVPPLEAFLALSVCLFVVITRPPSQLIRPSTLESILEGSFLGRANNLQCVYKASRDGWSALDFHRAVDGKGSGLVVARSLTGKVFGGYNPSGWRSTDDYYTSTAAFLWCLNGDKVIRLPVLAGGNAAVFDYATGGPCFSSDLQIGPPRAAVLGGFAGPDMEDLSINAGTLRQGKSAVGITYDWDDSWPARGSFQLIDLEVYCNE